MFRNQLIALVMIFCCTATMFVSAQDVSSLMKQGAELEKKFRDEEALNKYLEVVRYDPDNIDALCKVSELYNVIGKRLPEKEKQRDYYKKGTEYAAAALKINPNHAEANFAMAISMGRTALIASGEEKIKAVKQIKQYAD